MTGNNSSVVKTEMFMWQCTNS